MDYKRIEHLLNPFNLASKKVTVAGCGSGGMPVIQNLTMTGVRDWELYDPDTLDEVNLVKHPALRSDIYRQKVEIVCDWIKDRNPKANVVIHQKSIVNLPAFVEAVKVSDAVLCCVDTPSVREYINEVCVEYQVPCITGSVFRTGFGGEVYSYIPQETGCFACMENYCEKKGLSLNEDPLLTHEEQEEIYGYNKSNFQASGLSIDIGMIALLHARMALNVLLRNHETSLPKISWNWIVFGNRPYPGVFNNHFEAKRLKLSPQKSCYLKKCRECGEISKIS